MVMLGSQVHFFDNVLDFNCYGEYDIFFYHGPIFSVSVSKWDQVSENFLL